MTEKALDDKAWLKNPFTWRNNRGGYKAQGGTYITYGLPPPPHSRKETEQDMAGGDRIGFRQVIITPDMVGKTAAIFLSIEEKTNNDRLKPGQKKWHNFVIKMGGISEIWKVKKDETIKIDDGELT